MKNIKEEFLRDIAHHKMTINKDEGKYRHINFGIPNNSNLEFNITTFPYYLVITGDMGDYVFHSPSRIDMFDFFNLSEINPGYWAEKVVSESKFGKGIYYFDINVFRQNIIEYVKDYLNLEENEEIPEKYLNEIQFILDASDEYDCISELRNFTSDIINFDSFWEGTSCESFTHHYLWCCHAIQWSINQYYILKNKVIS